MYRLILTRKEESLFTKRYSKEIKCNEYSRIIVALISQRTRSNYPRGCRASVSFTRFVENSMDSRQGRTILGSIEICTCWIWIAIMRFHCCERCVYVLESWNWTDESWFDSQANETGMFSAPMKWLLLRDRSSVVGDSRDERETLKDMAVYPDSEVIVARKRMDGVVEISSVYRPSPFHEAIEEDRGNWTIEHGVRMPNLYPSSRRRRDLRRTPLKSCLVVFFLIISIDHELNLRISERTRAKLRSFHFGL